MNLNYKACAAPHELHCEEVVGFPAVTSPRNHRIVAPSKAAIFNFSMRKVGGITFIKLGRFGFSFWRSRAVPKTFQWED